MRRREPSGRSFTNIISQTSRRGGGPVSGGDVSSKELICRRFRSTRNLTGWNNFLAGRAKLPLYRTGHHSKFTGGTAVPRYHGDFRTIPSRAWILLYLGCV